jgi:hypothetical protein
MESHVIAFDWALEREDDLCTCLWAIGTWGLRRCRNAAVRDRVESASLSAIFIREAARRPNTDVRRPRMPGARRPFTSHHSALHPPLHRSRV